MSIEGQLQIRLTYAEGGVTGVSIASSRPVHASRAFHGKSLAESQKLLPLLFNICGTAQACAGVRAGEQALGLRVTPFAERLRESLVDLESLREHLWRVLLDWPGFIGREVEKLAMVEMAAIERDCRRLLCPDGDAFQLGGTGYRPDSEALLAVLERLDELLRLQVFGMPPAQWLALADRQALEAWVSAEKSTAAELIKRIMGDGWSSAGNCVSEPLPHLDEARLHEALRDDDFVVRPQWSGRCCESTSLTRMQTPLLADLKQSWGNGLLVRLVARLSEIAWLTGRLMPASEDAAGGKTEGLMPVNPGIGQVVAARGHLVHRITLQGERIERYQILAPTEWNFHPQGVAAAALAGLRGERAALEQQARLLVNAIDPCVGYRLELVEE
jgi:coenzyme F420-reducing hydrogenase alpha subunit